MTETTAPVTPAEKALAQIDALYSHSHSVYKTSFDTLANDVVPLVQKVCGLGKKGIALSEEISAALRPVADAIWALNKSAGMIKELRATLNAVIQDNVNLTHTLDQLNTQFTQQMIRVPRPLCRLHITEVPETFRNMPAPSYDEFSAVNSEASILSRLRFQMDETNHAVGVVVLISDSGSSQVRNHFEFEKFQRVAEGIMGRSLNLDVGADSSFLYQLVLGYAVGVADAAVSKFGPLSTLFIGDAERSDVFDVETDTVGEALYSPDVTDDSGVGTEDGRPDAVGDELDDDTPVQLPTEDFMLPSSDGPLSFNTPDFQGDETEPLDTSMDADLAAEIDSAFPAEPAYEPEAPQPTLSAEDDDLSDFLTDGEGAEVLMTEDGTEDDPDAPAPGQDGLFTVDPSLEFDDGDGAVNVHGGDADLDVSSDPLSRFAD